MLYEYATASGGGCVEERLNFQWRDEIIADLKTFYPGD